MDLLELTDRSEITDLVSRLGVWLDEKRWDDARSILTQDAIVTTPGGSARHRPGDRAGSSRPCGPDPARDHERLGRPRR